jgi:hypothetical protein
MTHNTLNTRLLMALGLSMESAEIVMGRIVELEQNNEELEASLKFSLDHQTKTERDNERLRAALESIISTTHECDPTNAHIAHRAIAIAGAALKKEGQ